MYYAIEVPRNTSAHRIQEVANELNYLHIRTFDLKEDRDEWISGYFTRLALSSKDKRVQELRRENKRRKC